MEFFKELTELNKAKQEAETGLLEAQNKLAELREKLQRLIATFPDIQIRSIQADTEKNQVLDLFVLGRVNQKELDRARENAAKAKAGEAEAAELIEAITRTIKNLEGSIPELQRRALLADRFLWGAIRDIETGKLKKSLGEGLIRAYACQLKTGSGNWPEFLQVLSGQYPDHERIKELQDILGREYGLE